MRRWCTVLSLILCFEAQAQTQIHGRTTGVLPYLEYGTGDDRLGGAKMTFLDTNVYVMVVDSFQSGYKVQLSARHFGFLPKVNFKPLDSLIRKPYYLSSSWRVWGDEHSDFVSVSLPERLPYSSQQQLNPSRIAIDLYGVTSNTNWITQLKTAKEIRNVWYEQVEHDVLRVYIDLRHQQHWGHSIAYRGNNLVVRIRRQPEKLRLKGLRIAIDAGHGGSNTGARSISTQAMEKDYTLQIAKALEDRLKCKKATVFMTRSTDTSLSMNERVLMLKEQDPDILVSIHLNSAGNTSVKGVSTYYRYVGFRPLTLAILDRMLELGLNNFGNIGAFNFSLSGPTEYPNCLVEVAFLSNAEDEQRILDPKFHREVAKKITKGMEDWLRAVKKQGR